MGEPRIRNVVVVENKRCLQLDGYSDGNYARTDENGKRYSLNKFQGDRRFLGVFDKDGRSILAKDISLPLADGANDVYIFVNGNKVVALPEDNRYGEDYLDFIKDYEYCGGAPDRKTFDSIKTLALRYRENRSEPKELDLSGGVPSCLNDHFLSIDHLSKLVKDGDKVFLAGMAHYFGKDGTSKEKLLGILAELENITPAECLPVSESDKRAASSGATTGTSPYVFEHSLVVNNSPWFVFNINNNESGAKDLMRSIKRDVRAQGPNLSVVIFMQRCSFDRRSWIVASAKEHDWKRPMHILHEETPIYSITDVLSNDGTYVGMRLPGRVTVAYIPNSAVPKARELYGKFIERLGLKEEKQPWVLSQIEETSDPEPNSPVTRN